MTLQPEDQKVAESETKQKFEVASISVLEDLFYLGYTTSEKICIYKDGNAEINVTFRTLTPTELRDVFERSAKFESLEGHAITEKLEILCRAITTINDMPLVLDNNDRSAFHEQEGRDPTPLEQARMIMFNKVKSPLVIEALYEAYDQFQTKISDNFTEIKKKLNSQTSSK